MKNLKFRIWDTKSKEYFEPIYEAYNGKLLDLSIGLGGDLLRRTLQLPAEHQSCFKGQYVIEQYVGRADNKGIDIYLGDKVFDGCSQIYTVVWDDTCCGFALSSIGDLTSFNEYSPECLEIVGNIHQ